MEGRAAREAWLALERELERERGMLGRLRALRTRTRVWLVAGLALAPTALMALRHHAALELLHGVVGGLVVALVAALLSPLSQPRRPAMRAFIAGLCALLPVAAALLSHDAAAHERSASAGACFGLGVAYATPSMLLALAVARTPIRSATELALLAGLCGISASLMLEMHCASRQLVHLLLGHASVGVAWAAAYQAAAGSASAASRSLRSR